MGLGKGRQGFHYKPQLPGHHTHLLNAIAQFSSTRDPFVVKRV